MKDLLKVLILLALAIIGMMSCTRADGDVGPTGVPNNYQLTNDTFTGAENIPMLLKVLKNDRIGLNGTLVYRQPQHGDLNISTEGLTYLPAKDFKGKDQFYYHYYHQQLADSALVTITVQ